MLKKLSILVILASLGTGGCRTVRLGDVLPETEGTQMGAVSIGRENVDFFVIPEPKSDSLPFELTMEGDEAVTSASSIVVFKTRERHPVHRTVHQLGAPVRAFDQVTSAAFDKAVAMAHSLVNWPGSKEQDSGTGVRPPALPTDREPELRARPLDSESGPSAAPIFQEPKSFAKPAVTTAASSRTQDNRNRG